MKIFRKLVTLFLTLALTIGLGALAACNNENGGSSSNSEATATSYKFQVLNADKSAASGYFIELYLLDENGAEISRFGPMMTDEDGKVDYIFCTTAGVYDISIMNGFMEPVEFDGTHKTSAAFSNKAITLTLK